MNNNQTHFMRTTILTREWRVFCQTRFLRQSRSIIVMVALLLAAANLFATPLVSWVSGGPSGLPFDTGAGYVDGDITYDARYSTPSGIAVDITGQTVYVADRNNNAIRLLEFDAPEGDTGSTSTFFTYVNDVEVYNLFRNPIGVAVDGSYNLFVLNRGNGNDGNVLEFDSAGDLVATNAAKLTNAVGLALDPIDNIYVSIKGNTLLRISPYIYSTNFTTVTNITPSSTNIVTITNILTTITPATNQTVITTNFPAGTSLQGIVVKYNGLIAACDSGRNGIYLIDPATGIVTTNAGFHGAGDFIHIASNIDSNSIAKFNQPTGITEAGDGSLIVTDLGNNRVKVVRASDGAVTNLYGVSSGNWSGSMPGFSGGDAATDNGWHETVQVPDTKVPNASARMPYGVAFAPNGSIYVTEDYYHIIRHVTGANFPPPPPPPPPAPTILTVTTNYGGVTLTWSTVASAVNYRLKRSTTPGGPYSIVVTLPGTSYGDSNLMAGATYYYVVSALNSYGGESPNSPEVSTLVPRPPVTDPQIGYVDAFGIFNTGNSFFFNNDVPIVIVSDPTALTYLTYSNTIIANLVANPGTNSAQAPPYQPGLSPNTYVVAQILPYLTIKAVSMKNDGSPNSQVAIATFQFITANPAINGANGAQFTISDLTIGARVYYTLDGSDPSPTNVNAVNLGAATTSTNTWTLSLAIQTNTLIKVIAMRDNYQPSAIVSNLFSTANFQPNVISFGFYSGEASSVFVASPGQTFYAPVTLTVLPSTVMDSLQFDLTVHSIGSSVPIASGAYGFQTMLMKPDPINPNYLLPIYPYMFINNATNPPPTNQIVHYEGTNFISMVTTNLSLNLLGVGWLERQGQTNLFNTLGQNLLSKSLAHDDVFPNPQQPSGTIVGGYSFQVPVTAAPTDTYQIQISRASSTADGISAAVYIYAPTNGSMAAGAMNAIKNVTMGQLKYTVGNVYPFRWFNAGDFGDTNLINADVMQVFQSAIYGLNFPPAGSDFFDAMDSCGATYADFGHGYLELNTTITDPNLLNLLFDGNDTTINQIAFGDGVLDVCDVYVTYRRSLDSSLTWFRRFWTNGVRVAEMAPNVVTSGMVSQAMKASKIINAADNSSSYVSITNQPRVIFTAGDCQTNAGKTIQIPITANIFGKYPLRTLMLNLTVVPIDGSPVLTTPVAFSYNPALGQPWTTDQKGNGNYSAVWLNNAISGLSNNVSVGTLTVTLPATATSLSAYAVHFDHVSASPNGLGSFPKLARTGLITFSSRNNSSYGDGIPDSWRLRYFLTLNNYLSKTNADADGDGLNNLQEYMAGTDPTDSTSCFKTIGNDLKAAQQPQDCVISWPSAIGKQYVIQRSPSLSARIWTPVATNSGNGTIMEYHDTSGGGIRYYRVSVQ